MKAKVIAIGDEILIGQVLDTNSNYIASKLKEINVELKKIVVCSDGYEDIMTELREGEAHYDYVFITGGLGPTKDDITKKCICDFFNTKLIRNEQMYQNVERLIMPRFGKMNPQNEEQAYVPETAKIYLNRLGTAPIMRLEKSNTKYYSMPGVPFEMKEAFEKDIMPELMEFSGNEVIEIRNVMVYGTGESFLAEKIETWENSLPNAIKLAYLPSLERIRLRLTATGYHRQVLTNLLDSKIKELEQIIPELIYSKEDKFLPEIVGELLTHKGKTLATAESCTGGNIAHNFTSIAGSSNYFKGSVVAYSNEIKERFLEVDSVDLKNFGAVSQQVVEQMAQGAQKALDSDYAIATSGIAGPGGGTKEKPVGTVWVAVCSRTEVKSKLLNLFGNRDRNITKSTVEAINMLRQEFLV